MISLLLLAMMLFINTSPLVFSFMVLTMSLWVAMVVLMMTSSMFSSCCMVISFSTGMMILFCYCSSMVSFEKKKLSKMNTVLPTIVFMLTTNSENMSELTNVSMTSMEYQLQFLTAVIMLVVATMLSVNKTMFNPSKSSMSAY
uniref:NADH dehydrogenase subunit 6 n=1 Tax=Histiostoma feroniarum TaxID=334618 RepID=A0A2Z4MB30_9ACAR|nr:NADH dehydrogenase subunit 6 [Histiostoma feroniarum]AWX53525.1 NADH dehydrogenase subunit 6 [Histiostoma feroniarum]